MTTTITTQHKQELITRYLQACKNWKAANTETDQIWASNDMDNWRNALLQEAGMTYRQIDELKTETTKD